MYKWTKKEMEYIESLILKYKKVLKLDNYSIEYTFQNGEVPDDEKYRDVAEMNTQISYYRAILTLYPFFLKRMRVYGKNDAVGFIKHELCHILTEPLYELAYTSFKSQKETERVREQLTEKISKLI